MPPRTIVHMVRGQARAVGAAPAVVSPEPVPADAVEKLRYILKLLRDYGGLIAA